MRENEAGGTSSFPEDHFLYQTKWLQKEYGPFQRFNGLLKNQETQKSQFSLYQMQKEGVKQNWKTNLVPRK